MFPIIHYIKGIAMNLFNPRVSLFAIISASVIMDKKVYIYRGVKAKKALIGAYTYIAANTEIENAEIGKFCSIADHCRIGMSAHSLRFMSTSPIFTQKVNALQECWIDKDVFEHKSVEERVYIGNDVWIGSHVLIKGGVHVGDGACIGAGAVVVKDIPPFAIVGGVPAKIIRYRFTDDVITKLLELKWWNWSEEKIKTNLKLFKKDNISVKDLEWINEKSSLY